MNKASKWQIMTCKINSLAKVEIMNVYKKLVILEKIMKALFPIKFICSHVYVKCSLVNKFPFDKCKHT